MERVYPPDIAAKNEEQIAESLVREAHEKRHGALSGRGTKGFPRRRQGALEHQSAHFHPQRLRHERSKSVGVKPQRVAIGHTCCLDDPSADIIKQIARRGAFVGFDRLTGGMVPDEKKVIMIQAFLECRLCGPPAHLLGFHGAANADSSRAGVKEETLRAIMVDNPRRFLAFVPKNFGRE
jgi:hypothetical protein